MEYFNLDGKTPEFSEVLIMRLIKGELTLSIFIEISSHPHEFFHGKE